MTLKGEKGETGETGQQGPRGNRGNDGRLVSINATRGFIVAFVCFLILVYWLLFHVTDENRQGCERLDAVRAVEYDVLNDAIPSLNAQAEAAETDRQQNLYEMRRDQYKVYVTELHVPEDYLADDPENPADIDCTKAYPYPFPLG